jgi:hypothetical protein
MKHDNIEATNASPRKESFTAVPAQKIWVGGILFVRGQRRERFIVQAIVLPPILEFLANSRAHQKPMVLGNSDVTIVEELVKIGSQQEAIGDLVRAHAGVGTNMSRLQDWQRSLPRHRAPSPISVGNQHSK